MLILSRLLTSVIKFLDLGDKTVEVTILLILYDTSAINFLLGNYESCLKFSNFGLPFGTYHNYMQQWVNFLNSNAAVLVQHFNYS